MTTPAYPELLSAVRREGEAILAAAGQGLDVAVPTCGDWRMPDLLKHIGSVYHRAATIVGTRATDSVAWREPSPDIEDPVAYFRDSLDDLVQALSEAEPDSPAWNWAGEPPVAAFWARRMTHESTVHRYDAQRAHGVAQPIDADLAHDGLDELVDLILPRIIKRDSPQLPEASYSFVATDEGAWHLRLGDGGAERLDAVKEPDVVVRATASALLLAAYARVKWTSLEIEGDQGLLDQWSAAIRF